MFKDFKYPLPELKMFLKKISCYTNLPSLGDFRKMEADFTVCSYKMFSW